MIDPSRDFDYKFINFVCLFPPKILFNFKRNIYGPDKSIHYFFDLILIDEKKIFNGHYISINNDYCIDEIKYYNIEESKKTFIMLEKKFELELDTLINYSDLFVEDKIENIQNMNDRHFIKFWSGIRSKKFFKEANYFEIEEMNQKRNIEDFEKLRINEKNFNEKQLFNSKYFFHELF